MKFGLSSALRYGTKNKILKGKNISDFIIIKNSCILKDIINKIKRQAIDLEKYLQIVHLMKNLNSENMNNT